MDSMYETLLGLPLFAGISRLKLSEILGKHKFHFLKYEPGATIVSEGEACTHIKSVINGSVRMTTDSPDGKFRISQTLTGPDIISPDFFFGRTTRYPADAKAIDNVGILQLDKSDFMKILNADDIFMLNYLNILSMNAQLAAQGVLALTSGSLEKRIAYWIIALTQTNGKDIILECRQKDMYAVFGVQRQSLVSALDNLQTQQIIEYSNNRISVLNRRMLMEILMQE